MQFVQAKEIAKLSHVNPPYFGTDVVDAFQDCYDRCVTFINAKLLERGKADLTSYTFSFWELLGEGYRRHQYRLYNTVSMNLEKEGYNVGFPAGVDDDVGPETHGVICISWVHGKPN